MLGRWKGESEELEDVFRGNGKLTPDQLELRQLKAENRQLRMEREILKKATAFFAKESK
jgi:transposase